MATPRPVFADPELSSVTAAARGAFDRGQPALAAQLFQRAMTRAEAMDRPGEIADLAYNYAVALTSLGRYDEAWELLEGAKAESERAGRPSTDVLLVEAKVARLRGRAAEAASLADRVLSQRPPATAGEQLQAHLAKGELAVDAKDATTAAAELTAAVRLQDVTTGPSLAARIHELEARLYLLKGDPVEAAEEFDKAASLLQQARLYRQMAQAEAASGRACQMAGLEGAASERLFRAARSTAAQGDVSEARSLAAAAANVAEKAPNADLQRRIAALLRRLDGPGEK